MVNAYTQGPTVEMDSPVNFVYHAYLKVSAHEIVVNEVRRLELHFGPRIHRILPMISNIAKLGDTPWDSDSRFFAFISKDFSRIVHLWLEMKLDS